MQKICHICKEKFEDKYAKYKKYYIVKNHCYCTGEYSGVAQNICNLKYSAPKEISIVFHNGSNYDYHFLKKKASRRILKAFYLFRRKYK